jgi:hypothetical protein
MRTCSDDRIVEQGGEFRRAARRLDQRQCGGDRAFAAGSDGSERGDAVLLHE